MLELAVSLCVFFLCTHKIHPNNSEYLNTELSIVPFWNFDCFPTIIGASLCSGPVNDVENLAAGSLMWQ